MSEDKIITFKGKKISINGSRFMVWKGPQRTNITLGVGRYHVIAIRNGENWAWGERRYGRLGDQFTSNMNVSQTVPKKVLDDWDFVEVSGGLNWSLGLDIDGKAWSWGFNDKGQLGDGSNTTRYIPVTVSNDIIFTKITTGDNTGIGIDNNGKLWSWGSGTYGALGNGNAFTQFAYHIKSPERMLVEEDFVDVSMGLYHGGAIDVNGDLWMWGYNNSGQLGFDDTVNRGTPEKIITTTKWAKISCGKDHTVAVDVEGNAFSCGRNIEGQLGVGRFSGIYRVLTPLDTTEKWNEVSSGTAHTLGISSTNDLWVWGENDLGQLGNGNLDNVHTPQNVSNGKKYKFIGTGLYWSITMDTNSNIWTTGYNQFGQLGVGDTNNRQLFTKVSI